MNTVVQPVPHARRGATLQEKLHDRGTVVDVAPRAMPAGLARLALFFIFVLASLVVTDHLITFGLRKIKTSTFGVMNRIVDGQINASILITGSSRALTHFDSRAIQQASGVSAFNIGINGSQTDMQVAVFKTYLKHNVKPDLLIHSLDSFSFVTSRDGVYSPSQYMPFLNEEDIYRALGAINDDIWKAKRLPLYRYAVGDMRLDWLMGMPALFGWNPREDRHLGFQPRHTSWTGDFERLRDSHPEGIRFDIEAEGVRIFEEMLALCSREGIRVLLVYSPVYYEMQALEQNRDELFALFREISTRHDATFWDFSGSPVSLRKDYFYNSQHLNAEGAALFSADLAARLARSPSARLK